MNDEDDVVCSCYEDDVCLLLLLFNNFLWSVVGRQQAALASSRHDHSLNWQAKFASRGFWYWLLRTILG